jgi:hypothetical protein
MVKIVEILDSGARSRKERDASLPPFDWFNRAFTVNSIELDAFVDELSVELDFSRPSVSKRSIKSILLNFIFSESKRLGLYRGLSYIYPQRYNPLDINVRALNTVVDKLEEGAYISQVVGRWGESVTILEQTEKLKQEFCCRCLNSSWLNLLYLGDSVVLKDQDKRLIDYEDDEYTRYVRSFIAKYEEFLSGFEICYGENRDIDHPYCVKRVFNSGSFNRGGRLVGPWAGIKKEERAKLCIDGEETAEIDMPSSALNILYRAATGKPYQGEDAYELIIEGRKVDRDFVKLASNISQNTQRQKVIDVLHGQIAKNAALSRFEELGISYTQLLEAFEEKHKALSPWLFKPIRGLQTQWAESELIFMVLEQLVREGIPVLSVYDSIIVRKGDKDRAEEILWSTADDAMDSYLLPLLTE